eukprot:407871_1
MQPSSQIRNSNVESLSEWLHRQKSFGMNKKKSTVYNSGRCLVCIIVILIVSLYLICGDIIHLNIDKTLISDIINHTIETKLDDDKNIFQQYLHSHIDNTNISCNPSHFKYIELLLKEIHKHNKTFHFKWNSSSISNALAAHIGWVPKEKNVRLKYYNNKLYLHIPYGYKGRGWSKTYCTAFIAYFYKFTQKYKYNLPSFDIVIYVMDSLRYHYNFVDNYNELPPIFVSDSVKDEHTNVLFHGLPRSIIKNYNYKIQRFLSSDNNNTNPDVFPTQFRIYKDLLFNNKINKILFRGQMTNKMRDDAIYELNYGNISTSFVDAKLISPSWTPVKYPIKCIPYNDSRNKCWSLERMPEAAQEKYKYIVVIDGFTTRDGFALQMPYDSVKLKYKSNLYEFWYYDLIDKENILFWETPQQLINIANDLNKNKIKNIEEIAMNSANYAKTHFDENSLHCFTLHMINIYNTYFFNESEIELDENDREINPHGYFPFRNTLINLNRLLNTTINMF